MSDGALRRCLTDGMQPAAWYEMLNGRVFFWLTRSRLLKLLAGKEYRGAEHDVLEVDTQALVSAYRADIKLSPVNSGAPYHANPVPRGPHTFQTIARFDYAGRRKSHAVAKCAVELTVDYAIPDIVRFLNRVVVMRGDAVAAQVYQR